MKRGLLAHITEKISRGGNCGEQARLDPQAERMTPRFSISVSYAYFPQSWLYSQVSHSEPHSSRITTVVAKNGCSSSRCHNLTPYNF